MIKVSVRLNPQTGRIKLDANIVSAVASASVAEYNRTFIQQYGHGMRPAIWNRTFAEKALYLN